MAVDDPQLIDVEMPAGAGATHERRTVSKWLVAGAVGVAVLGAGLWTFAGGDPASSTKGFREVLAPGGEPREVASTDLDGELRGAWRLADLVILQMDVEDDPDDRVVAVKLENGSEQWDDSASAVTVVGSRVVIAQGEDLLILDQNGREVEKSLRLRDPIVGLFNAGALVVAFAEDGESVLVNVAKWEVSARDIGLVSSDRQRLAQRDRSDDRVRVQQIDPASGDRIGKRIQISDRAFDYELLDDGRLAVLDDRSISILDTDGKTVASASAAKDAYEITSAVGGFIAVVDTKQTTVYSLDGNDLRKIGPDIDGSAELWRVGSEIYGVADPDEDSEFYRISGNEVEFVFDAPGFAKASATGAYVIDGDDLDFYRLPGDTRAAWSIRRDEDEEYFEFVDGLVLRVAYSPSDDSTDVAFFG